MKLEGTFTRTEKVLWSLTGGMVLLWLLVVVAWMPRVAMLYLAGVV